jgi:hypothetical protein
MKHGKHLLFAFLVIVIAGLGGAIGLSALVPDDFGLQEGGRSYRGGSLAEHADRKDPPMAYAASDSCQRPDCHGAKAEDEELRVILDDGHEKIGCQTCHGPGHSHVEYGGTEDAPVASATAEACLVCHRRVAGRPAAIKQITDLKSHLADVKGDEQETCVACHNPHTCTAMQLAGGHKALSCDACHGGPNALPKAAEPEASKEIAVCMGCHGEDATGPHKSKKVLEDFEGHRDDMGGEDEEACAECHDPHTTETY